MNAQIKHVASVYENPIITVKMDGTVLQSNAASEPLLSEWCNGFGDKLASNIIEIIQRVISLNNPEKIEVKVGNRTYLIVFSHLPEQEYVIISGFDISDQKELEKKLWESEEKFRSAFEDSAVAMALVSPDAHLLKVNNSCCKLFGFKKSEMESFTFIDITYPDDIEQSILNHKAVINREKPLFWLEKRFIRKDGRMIWCEVSSSPVFDSKGCPIYTVAHIQDISKRKRAENALKKEHDALEEKVKDRTAELEKALNSLKESEERLAEAQKLAHVGSYDWNITTNEEYWSDEMYHIFGLDPESELNHNTFLKRIHLGDLEYVSHTINEALNGNPFCIDFRIFLSDGEERVIHSRGGAIYDEKNTPIRMRGIAQDITGRKKAEEMLIESEGKLKALFNILPVGVSITDNERNVRDANITLERILGFTKSDLQNGRFENRKYIRSDGTDLPPEEMPSVKALKEKGSIQSSELGIIKEDGSTVWVDVSAIALPFSNGQVVITTRDITENKKAEEAIKLLEKARKKEIHHRIKNNLQVISSLLDLQADKIRNKKKITKSEVLESFKESQDRVISMALIHEELHSGGDTDIIHFPKYIEELSDNLFLSYRRGNVNTKIIHDVEEGIFFDMDTAVPLGLIVNELISNSLKNAFIDRDDGEIRIKLQKEENRECIKDECKNNTYVLSISDNGVGIPEDLDLENLDSLGLQLVTNLVEQLDGELEMNGDNGTEFIIRFTATENQNHVQASIS